MERSRIHQQLLADCHHLGSLNTSEVLLNRNAALPWFILVPDTRIADLLDLPVPEVDAEFLDALVAYAFPGNVRQLRN